MNTIQEVKTTVTRSAKQKRGKAKSPTEGGQSVSMTLLRTVPLFPVSKVVTGMIYYDYQKTLTGGLGAVPTQFYCANGLFDPDVSGTGHQPMGFDQMMALYEQYTVLSSHIKVTFASAGDHARVGIYLNPDTTSVGLPRLVENGLIKMGKVCGPATSNGQHAFSTLELSCNIPEYFGRSRQAVIADPQLYGTIAVNPAETVNYAVCAWGAFDASVDVTVGYDFVITYDVLFWEPKKLASS